MERGIEHGISGTIKILAGLDYSDEQIAEQLIKQFAIDEEQAYKYILIAKKKLTLIPKSDIKIINSMLLDFKKSRH